MMDSAHNRYNLLFRQTHKTQMIHHFALLLFKNYLTIQVGSLQRIHRQYIRYESVLDDALIGIENLNSGYLTHHILDPQVLSKYLETIEDDLGETAPEYEPVFTSVYQYYGANSLFFFFFVWLFAGFLVPSCPKRALVWGMVVRGFAR